jgi:pimeloyl-ACP methyl ester carboxylesterase
MDLFLGDYISLHDEITLTDLGAALQRALLANEIPTTRHSFDLIVHSTGGLVALEYLRQACVKGSTRDASLTPVRNLCFLAPASFGSPLAAKGKSLIGRTLKGWSWDRLLQKPGRLGQTGQRVLDALELASPYSWQLGLDTLFDFKFPLFTWENVRPTIMVGSAPYDSIAKYTHERGSDGTVRVSTANLNAHHYKVDFASPNDPALDPVKRSGRPAAFAVFNRNHGDICSPDTNLDQAAEWQATLLRALSFSNARADYQKHVASCDQLTQQTFQQHAADPNFHEYMHVVFRVRDQFGDPIPDYVIDFYQPTGDPKDKVYGAIHQEILEKVTTNTRDASLRSFLFDITDLRAFLTAKPSALVNMSVAAAPISADIFYHNPSATAPGVPIFRNDSPDFVHPNEPVLVDITLHRTGSPRVFKLSKA